MTCTSRNHDASPCRLDRGHDGRHRNTDNPDMTYVWGPAHLQEGCKSEQVRCKSEQVGHTTEVDR